MQQRIFGRWSGILMILAATMMVMASCGAPEPEDLPHESDYYPGVAEQMLQGDTILTFQNGIDNYASCRTVDITRPSWGDGNGVAYGDSYYSSQGTSAAMCVDPSYGSNVLVRFDALVGTLHAGEHVDAAELHVYGVVPTALPVSAIVDLLSEPWEANPSPTPSVVGWRYRLSNNVEWSARGADGAGSRIAGESAQFTVLAYSEPEIVITVNPQIVEGWMDGTQPNNGFLIRYIAGQNHLGIRPGVYPTISKRPKLMVGISSGTPNVLPTVSITSPVSGTTVAEHDTVTFQFAAADSDGSVTHVVLSEGQTMRCEATAAPFTSCSWSDVGAPGDHVITARVYDNSGAWVDSAPVTVTITNVNDPPVITGGPTATPSSAQTGATVNLSVTATDPDPNTTLTYAWDVQLNGTSVATMTGANASFISNAAGTYTATVTASDGALSTSASVQVTVTEYVNYAPVINSLTATPNPTTPNASVTITVAATDQNGDSLTYVCTYGDGGSGTGASESHAYVAVGTYPVTCTATDPAGLYDTKMVNVVVQAPSEVTKTFRDGVNGYAGTRYIKISDQNGLAPSNGFDGSTTPPPFASNTVKEGAAGDRHRILLGFDLSGPSGVPANATITAAKITLTFNTNWNSLGYRVYHGNVAYAYSGETFNTQNSTFGFTHRGTFGGTVQSWPDLGALGASSVHDFASPKTGTLAANSNEQTVEITLEAAWIQEWLSNPLYGLVISTSSSSNYLNVREPGHATANYRPQLTVTYTQ